MKKRIVIFALVSATVVIVGILLFNYQQLIKVYSQETSKEISAFRDEEAEVMAPSEDAMTFRVKIPENTPEEDTIGISLYTQSLLQMKKIGNDLYEVKVSTDQINFVATDMSGKNVWYAYVRNQFQDTGAPYSSEFIPGTPNTNDYFNTRRGRTAVFTPGTVQEDTIFRWKWFPKEGWPMEDISDFGPDRNFEPRIDHVLFRSGQGLMDEYRPWMDHLFTPTAQHMRELGYEWIIIFPSWDWDSDKPKLRHLKKDEQSGDVLGFPDDKTRKQIHDFKAGGLNVILAPQICCTNLNRESRSAEWWNMYWEEVERFYIHYANVAQEEHVEALIANFAPIGNTEGMGKEISQIEQEAWSKIWESVRKVYSGERGQMVWLFNSGMGGLTPEPSFITWASDVDFFYVQSVAGISDNSNPTAEELYKGAKDVFLDIKRIHDVYGKPVIVQSQFSSISKAWKGEFSEFKPAVNICGDDNSDEGCNAFFSGHDQARAIHAYWQVIAEEPWVIGYTNFGYRPEEIPLKPEWSVRGKPADKVWKKWNSLIYQNK